LNELMAPASTGEDRRRREYLLNVILVLSLACLVILGTTIVWNWDIQGDAYAGIRPLTFGAIILFYAILFTMSKRGYGRSASILLVISDALGAILSGWVWGASLPATLLLTALVIVTASVLLGSTKGFIVAAGMIGILSILGVHEAVVLNVPDWRYDEITATDVISYAALLLFMSFIGWLSNREIKISLERARHSEKLLEMERNILEKRVAERTEELVVSQRSIVDGLRHSASVGELSQGVFHDLMNPLSAIALYIEDIAGTQGGTYGRGANQMQDMVAKAMAASRRMGSFMDSVRRHIGRGESMESLVADGTEDVVTNIGKEIIIARDILAYKARMANVRIITGQCDSMMIVAHPVRIHQMLLNLISNAIDACASTAKEKAREKVGEKIVRISALKSGKHAPNPGDNIQIIVADNGCGIPIERLKTLFVQPYTTKPEGNGIGLMTVKSIVEKELGGSIKVTSAEGVGTTFIITIPISAHGKSAHGKGGHEKSHTPHP
jgi:signal transduction histidine kinase